MPDNIALPKQQRKSVKQFLPRLLLVSAYFWIPMLIFLFLANQVREKNPLPGDVAILEAIHKVSSPFMDKLAVLVTTMGSAAVVVIGITIAVGVLQYRHHTRQAIFLIFATIGTVVINILFKLLFHRARPQLWPRIVTENAYSFPSGHAMISSALAFSFILLCWNTHYRVWAIAGGVIYFVLVGLSRLYLGVHYPSDVIGGWAVSVLWVLTIHYAFGHFGTRRTSVTTSVSSNTSDDHSK